MSDTKKETCPNCGYCPHCGQSRQAAPAYPNFPYWPHYVGPVSPWWGVTPPPYVYQPTWTSDSIPATGGTTTAGPHPFTFTVT